VLGVLEKKLTGEWDKTEEYELLKQFYVTDMLGNKFVTDSEWFETYKDQLFIDNHDALDYISQKYAEDRERDR
jgi:hypothetical protein